MWMMPLHLHVNQKSDYDMMMMMMFAFVVSSITVDLSSEYNHVTSSHSVSYSESLVKRSSVDFLSDTHFLLYAGDFPGVRINKVFFDGFAGVLVAAGLNTNRCFFPRTRKLPRRRFPRNGIFCNLYKNKFQSMICCFLHIQ